MIRGYAHKRRRAAMIKIVLVLATAVVLFTPRLDDFRLPDVGSVPFVTGVQAGEN